MGLAYNTYLTSNKIYGCKTCKAHLANHEDIISRVRVTCLPSRNTLKLPSSPISHSHHIKLVVTLAFCLSLFSPPPLSLSPHTHTTLVSSIRVRKHPN